MQTILGGSGQTGQELAIHLQRDFVRDLRLVSRHPRQVNRADHLHPADLLDAAAARQPVAGSEIVALTAGRPLDTCQWVAPWQVSMANMVAA